ncbi:MAG: alpha/beta hydrolase [Bacteroidia bacterium]
MKHIFLTLILFGLISCQKGDSLPVQQSTVPLTEQHLETPKGNSLSYIEMGSGPALVFIHAGGLDKAMWKEQIQVFGKDYRAIAYDLRGHGKTTFSNDSIPEIEDLLALMEQLGIEKANLVILFPSKTKLIELK